MSNVTLKHTPVKKLAPQITLFSSLRCVLAAEQHTADHAVLQTGRTQPWKHLSRSNQSLNTRQDFLRIPSLWKLSPSGNQAKVPLKSLLGIKCHGQYIKVIRLFQYRSANSYWRLLVMHCSWPGLTRIHTRLPYSHHIFVLLAFNSTLHRSLHTPTVPRSLFKDSAAGGGTTASS